MNLGEEIYHTVRVMVKDKENVDVVIPTEELLDVMDCIYVDVVFMKLGKILDLKGSNK
jgi:hypothetical protein